LLSRFLSEEQISKPNRVFEKAVSDDLKLSNSLMRFAGSW